MTGRRVLRATRIVKNNHGKKAAGNALVIQLAKAKAHRNLSEIYAYKWIGIDTVLFFKARLSRRCLQP
jgi:hypothetical protein